LTFTLFDKSVYTTIKGPHCFLEQESLLLLLSTGWFEPGTDTNVISQPN